MDNNTNLPLNEDPRPGFNGAPVYEITNTSENSLNPFINQPRIKASKGTWAGKIIRGLRNSSVSKLFKRKNTSARGETPDATNSALLSKTILPNLETSGINYAPSTRLDSSRSGPGAFEKYPTTPERGYICI